MAARTRWVKSHGHGHLRQYRATDGTALLGGRGAGTPEDSEARAITAELEAGLEEQIRAIFEAAGDAPLAAEPQILAKFVLANMRGLSQLASDGTDLDALLAVADLAASGRVTSADE